jgi:hypothetical protein
LASIRYSLAPVTAVLLLGLDRAAHTPQRCRACWRRAPPPTHPISSQHMHCCSQGRELAAWGQYADATAPTTSFWYSSGPMKIRQMYHKRNIGNLTHLSSRPPARVHLEAQHRITDWCGTAVEVAPSPAQSSLQPCTTPHACPCQPACCVWRVRS